MEFLITISLIIFVTFTVCYLYFISKKIDLLSDKLNGKIKLNTESKEILDTLRESNRKINQFDKRFNELNQNIKSKAYKKNIANEVLVEEDKNIII
jgi:hypothetical protein